MYLLLHSLLFADSLVVVSYMAIGLVTILFLSMFSMLIAIILVMLNVGVEEGILGRKRRPKKPKTPVQNSGRARSNGEGPNDTSGTNMSGTETEAEPARPPPRYASQVGRLLNMLYIVNKMYFLIALFLTICLTLYVGVLMMDFVLKNWGLADNYAKETSVTTFADVVPHEKGAKPKPFL